MSLTVHADPREAAVSVPEILTELAIVLYEREKLSVGWAARLAGMDRWAFNDLLADREVPMHYDIADLERDLEALRRLDQR